jgi:aryl-alcohol dehydrogenase-like predicted oxidoreductase
MEYRRLGATGITVSTHCLGTMMLGVGGNEDVDECIRMVHAAIDAGVNFFDAADVYSRGESEEILGRALAGRRDDAVVATKFFMPMGTDPNRSGGSRRWIMRAVEDSLQRLGTDYIDVYQMHRPDPRADIEESLGALSDLVHQGKVRTIGSTTFAAHEIVAAQWAASRRNTERFRTEQPPYSLFVRRNERDVFPVCLEYGMGVLVYAPLNSGWLAGRYTRDAPPPDGTRAARGWGGPDRWDREKAAVQAKFDLLDELREVAVDAGCSLTHLAIAFSLEHPAVTSTIIGPRTLEQLDDLLAGADVRLSADVLDRIDDLLPPGTDVNRDDVRVVSTALDVSRRRRV